MTSRSGSENAQEKLGISFWIRNQGRKDNGKDITEACQKDLGAKLRGSPWLKIEIF